MGTFQKGHIPKSAHSKKSTFHKGNKGLVSFLECALFGMYYFWNVPFLECALFGMCTFWKVHFLECVHFGMHIPKRAHSKKGTEFLVANINMVDSWGC